MLSRWLASLPVQLSQLGHRNPMLSAQLILSIQAAASRGNKDMLSSLQTHACTLYGEHVALCSDHNVWGRLRNVFWGGGANAAIILEN